MKSQLFPLHFFRVESSILFFILSISFCQLEAQEHSNLISKADKKFEAFAYIDAQAIYLEVAEKGYSSFNLYKKLADSYYFTGDLESSEKWYRKLIENYAENIDPEYFFRYAQSLKSIERYREADSIMGQFTVRTRDDMRAKSFMTKRHYMDFIDMQSGRFDLIYLDINSPQSDYAPSFNHKNQVVFASSRLDEAESSKLHEWNKMPFLDLYFSPIQQDEISLGNIEKLEGKINTKFHESSSSFSQDGNTVYFTRNNYNKSRLRKNSEGIVLLKIYKSTFENGKWQKAKELPFCSNDYSVSHPSLSPDGSKLYFASDMPGSVGKSDLYVVTVNDDGTYGTPENLGDEVNTEGRETFPYISNTGRLYFSSDGHVGLGGLDVFIAIPRGNTFSSVYNVGRPINSPKDDFSFVINESRTGYFASNRTGGKGDDDIYGFEQTLELITSCKQYVDGVITDIKTGAVLSSVEVTLLDSNGNVIDRKMSDEEGKYNFEAACSKVYTIQANKESYVLKSVPFETTDAYEEKHDVPIALEEEQLISNNIAVRVGDDLAQVLQLQPIYFDLDTYNITRESEVELQKVIVALQNNPKMKIEVRSHTDSRSSFWYNKKLSVKRMRATIKYIVEEGNIYWRRVRGKAYGERRLINKCADGVPCTEEEHLENRRSEFIILEK